MSAGPTFAQQRLVCIALLLGITFYAVVVGVLLQSTGKGLGAAPLPELDTVAIALGAAMAIGAVTARGVLRRLAERAEPEARAAARFRAVLVPIAMLEGGCLFGITVWMLNGNPVPGLAVAMVLLAIAIVLVPFTDPDAR